MRGQDLPRSQVVSFHEDELQAGPLPLRKRAFRSFLMRGQEPYAIGFPDGIDREGQAGEMAQLAAGQANVFQLEIVEALEIEELFPAAPIADELAQG